MLRAYLAAIAALLTVACAPRAVPPRTPTPVEASGPAATSTAARAFGAAEIEWQSAIAVGRALVARGVIRGETASRVREWNGQARAAIVAGKAGVDIAAQARATAELLRLTRLLDAITGRK